MPAWLATLLLLVGLLVIAREHPGNAQVIPGPIGQGGASPNPPFVARGTHLFTAGPTPTLQGCGTDAVITGSDYAGNIILGSDYNPAGPCFIVFNQIYAPGFTTGPWFVTPLSCVATMGNYPMPPTDFSYFVQAGSIQLKGGVASNPAGAFTTVRYHCIGTQLPP
jgi:hypothetical protein